MFTNQQAQILLIEGTETLTEIIKAYCDAYQIECTSFSTAPEALDNFRTNQTKYQLIITDVSLDSDANGIALVNGLKHLNRQKRMPAILGITNNFDESVRATLLHAGINDVLAQTSDLTIIASLANSLITNKLLLDQIDAQKEELNSLTLTDSLTGLYNRHYLVDQTNKFIPLAKRQEIPLSLVAINIESFEGITRTYGHQSGDIVLQCIGTLIRSTSRGEDISSRFDTHEFVILLPYCELEGAKTKAARLKDAIQKLNPDNIEVAASVHATSVPLEMPCDWKKLLQELH